VNSMDASKIEYRVGNLRPISALVKTLDHKGQFIVRDSNPFYDYETGLPTNANTASSNAANQRASAAIFKAIRNEQYQISGPTFLGELRESLQMVRRPNVALMKSWGKYMERVEKNTKSIVSRPRSTRAYKDRFGNWQPIDGKKARLSEVNAMIADTYIETSFGWIPLISDVKNGAIALARLQMEKRHSRVSAVGVDSVINLRQNGVIASSPLSYDYSIVDSSDVRVSYKVGLNASLNTPAGTTDRLLELLGFNWGEFLPTVWECLPWSFLTDYVTNVGEVLSAYTTDVSRVTWVSKTEKTMRLRHVDVRLNLPACLSNWTDRWVMPLQTDGGFYESEVSSVKRRAGLDYPSLTFSLPKPAPVGNMVALLAAQGRMRNNSFL